MCQPTLSVWFVCRLCRGSFGQVDAFIEHKKQKHFTQFQNTTSIVFEERELRELFPVIIKAEDQLLDENNEPRIKTEVCENDDTFIPFSLEIIDEPNLSLEEPKKEAIIYESEINPENENRFFGLKQPEQNPCLLLKRLTSEEIQKASACVPQHRSSLLKCEQKFFANRSEPPWSLLADTNIIDHNPDKNFAEIQPTATVEHDLQRECKLCSKKLESEAQLKIHFGICALYHQDRNRFCVVCNRKFCNTKILEDHRLRFHGTEEEKSSLYKFKCHVCSKSFRQAMYLNYHLGTHKENIQQVSPSNSKLFKCSHPTCEKEFRLNSNLRRHEATVHVAVRPFSCSFANCNKTFRRKDNVERHFMIHTGERPFKCTVENCNKAFQTSSKRSVHHRTVHDH